VGRLLTVRRIILTSVVLLLAAAGLLPIMVMLWKAVHVEGHLSAALCKQALFSARAAPLIRHSLVLAGSTTALALAFGLPAGILFARTDLPFRRTLAVLFTVPLLIPPYITAVSWFDLLGQEGLVARFLGPSAAGSTSAWLFGLPGCVLVLFSTFMPIVMLLTMACIRTVNPRLEEAARLAARWPFVLRRISIPLIMPGVILGAMLVFLLSIGEFGVPVFLRYDVFPVETFTQFSAFYNFGAATAAALPLVGIAFVVLALERIFLRERTYQLQPAPADERPQPIPWAAPGPGYSRSPRSCVSSCPSSRSSSSSSALSHWPPTARRSRARATASPGVSSTVPSAPRS